MSLIEILGNKLESMYRWTIVIGMMYESHSADIIANRGVGDDKCQCFFKGVFVDPILPIERDVENEVTHHQAVEYLSNAIDCIKETNVTFMSITISMCVASSPREQSNHSFTIKAENITTVLDQLYAYLELDFPDIMKKSARKE